MAPRGRRPPACSGRGPVEQLEHSHEDGGVRAVLAAVKVKPLSDVQAMCGAAHISTTMRYVHHQPGARDDELLAAAFAEPDDLERAVSRDVSPTGRIGAQAA